MEENFLFSLVGPTEALQCDSAQIRLFSNASRRCCIRARPDGNLPYKDSDWNPVGAASDHEV